MHHLTKLISEEEHLIHFPKFCIDRDKDQAYKDQDKDKD